VDLRALIPLVLAAAGAAAAEIDPGAVADPRMVRMADRAADARWRALFAPDPAWVSRQVSYLSATTGDLAPTLLAARLLYRGEPWTRRGTEQVNPRRWRAADQEVRLAILREVRWRREPGFVPVLRALLAAERNPAVAASALTTLWLLDGAAGTAAAEALADPRGEGTRLPASGSAQVRERALSLLLDVQGPDTPGSRRALGWALLEAAGSERNHAITALAPGQVGDLLQAAILRLCAERRAGTLDDDGQAGLAQACTRIAGSISPELATALVEVAVEGGREIATPAATALAGNLGWTATVAADAIARRAANDPDPVVRHALSALLLRIKPGLLSAGAADNPWTLMGTHRDRLSKWEWEQYAR
jgi:hypothetical protein